MIKWIFTALACTTMIILGVVTLSRQPQQTLLHSLGFEEQTKQTTKLNHSLKHIGIIMDGNRRWAKKQSKKPWEGHRGGIEPVKQTVEFCIEQKIPHLSLYTFSLENFNRSQQELDELFSTIEQGLTNKEFKKLTQNGVRVRFVGDRSRFPDQLLKTINNIEETTKTGEKLVLNLLFCYGGQQELTAVMQNLGTQIAEGKIKPGAITPELIQQHLWTANSPNPDLVIRTSGVQRLSNFLPWQSAYSELLFIDKYWPEITKKDLLTALKQFETVKRNFGT